jgi:uncharacterized protein YccT (UPF0319 family)
MKARTSIIALVAGLFLTCLTETGFAQTIGRKKPKMELLSYNPLKDDGELALEIDVRMADCISHLELLSENSRKPIKVDIGESNYYLSEDGEEQIYMRVSLGSMKEILKKKKELPSDLTIYSKSGKPIYSKQLNLVKDELISSLSRN